MERTIFAEFSKTFSELACAEAKSRIEITSGLQRPASSGLKAAFSKRKDPVMLFSYTARRWLDALVGLTGLYASRKEALACLDRFLDAHLVHCPSNRTVHRVAGENTKLQPTAKGVAVLEMWFYTQPFEVVTRMDEVRAILRSPFNTMDLVQLERTVGSGRLYVSTGVAILLWNRMFGTTPQVYRGPEKLDEAAYNMRVKEDLEHRLNPLTQFASGRDPQQVHGMDVHSIQLEPVFSPARNLDAVGLASVSSHHNLGGSCGGSLNQPCDVIVPHLEFDQVPYYARSMIHPNSTNLMHYFDNRGVRFFESLRFEKATKSRFGSTVPFSASHIVSGHAIWQWIMDCTTVTSSMEGIMLAEMMLENGFIARVREPVIDAWAAIGSGTPNAAKDRHLGTGCLYRFTPRGRRMIRWGSKYIQDEDIDQKALNEEDKYNLFVSSREGSRDRSSSSSSKSSRIVGPSSNSRTLPAAAFEEKDCDADSLLRSALAAYDGPSPNFAVTHGFITGDSDSEPATPLPPYTIGSTRSSILALKELNGTQAAATAAATTTEQVPKRLRRRSKQDGAPQPPFPGRAWRWEYSFDGASVETTFDNHVGLQLIMQEPALKLLFKEHLQEKHCRAPVDFVGQSEFFLGLIEEWYEARDTVTRRDELHAACLNYAQQLNALYMQQGAPLELNITAKQRKSWLIAMQSLQQRRDFLRLVPILGTLRVECWRVLEGCAMDFKRAKTLKRVPGFRKYVVAKTIPKTQLQAAGVAH